MYEWLEEEVATIRDRKFHMIRGRAPILKAREKMTIDWPVSPPPEYQQFLSRFGMSFLYRQESNWQLRLFDRPIIVRDASGRIFLECVGNGSNSALFELSSMKETGDSPVYDDRARVFKPRGSFSEWLEARARSARRQYTKREWRQIVEGPPPFTPEEEELVAARRMFEWHKAGVSPEGKLILELTNHSSVVVPFLTFTLTLPRRDLLGGIWLPVSGVRPGETHRIETYPYTRIKTVEEVDMALAPDPWPEDRSQYWEFNKD